MALAYTMSIVDPCIDIWGCSEGQDEQFGTPTGLLRPSGRYGFSGAHICARCGSELVGCQCLETTVVPAKTALPFTASPQYRHPSSSPKKNLIFNGKAKFLFCHYVAACVWETYQIVIQPVWLQQRDLFWACPPFTAAFQIPPLFRQSRDRRYLLEGGWLYSKSSAILGATSSGPINSKLMKALEKFAPPFIIISEINLIQFHNFIYDLRITDHQNDY